MIGADKLPSPIGGQLTRKMIATVVAFAVGLMMVVMGASPTTATPPAKAGSEKVYVCKYVGTPGVDERLQTGNNPIEVSVNAIQNNQWDGTVPGWFSDAHDRSYVLGYVPMSPEPTSADCPKPDSPEEPTRVTPVPPTLTDPTCTAAGSLTIPVQPEGVVVTPAAGTYGVGTYDVDFESASDKYELTAEPDKTYTVEEKIPSQSTDPNALCYEEPKGPTEISANGEPKFIDKCGVTNDDFILPANTDLLVWSWNGAGEPGTNERIIEVRVKLTDKAVEENYKLVGKTFWSYSFDDIGCPDPEVNKGEKVETFKTSSYECGDAFKVVKTVTLTTPWTQAEGEDKVYGETVRTVERERIPVEVVPCDTDEPKEPNTPVTTPDEPKDKATPAVPTSVDAGLASVDPVAKK